MTPATSSKPIDPPLSPDEGEATCEISARFDRTRLDHKTELTEDYVEMIAELIEATGEARAADLSARFGVTAATVNNTIQRLQRDGHVNSEPYRSIFLTDKGRDLAEACKRRHDVVESFLLSLGVPDEVARLDAEGIEHHCSQATLEAMQRHLSQVEAKKE